MPRPVERTEIPPNPTHQRKGPRVLEGKSSANLNWSGVSLNDTAYIVPPSEIGVTTDFEFENRVANGRKDVLIRADYYS